MTDQSDLHLRQKPPTEEDEYWAREDKERIARLQEERRAREESEGAEKLKALHWMHCPKCGTELVEEQKMGVLIDRCPSCNGVWLDATEAAALSGRHSGLSHKLLSWLGSSTR